jgi:hypothetical protein
MPEGVSSPYYPKQDGPNYRLEPDNSYFLAKLRDAQVFFPASWPRQADFVIASTEVSSSSYLDRSVKSLYKVSLVEKNKPVRLGLSVNLTDWLPALADASIRLALTYTVVQGAPFKTLLDKMGETNLAAKVSLVRPDLGVAIKITEIAGYLLSYFAQEGQQVDVFPLTMDLNLADLQVGCYVVVGSKNEATWPDPKLLKMEGDQLAYPTGGVLDKLSYAVIEVLGTPRRKPEAVRRTAWGELLYTAKDRILDALAPRDDQARTEAFTEWRGALSQVRTLARKDLSFLGQEVDEAIAEAQNVVEAKLFPAVTRQAGGIEEYPEEWQAILGVANGEELRRAVRDYQDAVALSEQLLREYGVDDL